MKKAILFANGEYDSSYTYSREDFIIAIDGGYDILFELGIKPSLVVGDLDSISKPIPSDIKVIRLSVEKDDTDALYALKWALKEGFDTFELHAFLGKDLNHTLGNIELFLHLKKLGVNFKAYYQNKTYQVLHDECFEISKGKDKFTLLSLSEYSIASLYNVKYEVINHKFTNDIPLGIDNEFINKKAQIQVDSGYMLLIY